MGNEVKKRRHVPNPTGKGGLGDRPQDRSTRAGPGRGHRKKIVYGTEVLDDLDRAYKTVPDPKEPEGVKSARKLLKSNYEKFLTLYTKAKEEARMAAPVAETDAATAPTELPAGAKEARVRELIERLLSEWEDMEAARAAQGTE